MHLVVSVGGYTAQYDGLHSGRITEPRLRDEQRTDDMTPVCDTRENE